MSKEMRKSNLNPSMRTKVANSSAEIKAQIIDTMRRRLAEIEASDNVCGFVLAIISDDGDSLSGEVQIGGDPRAQTLAVDRIAYASLAGMVEHGIVPRSAEARLIALAEGGNIDQDALVRLAIPCAIAAAQAAQREAEAGKARDALMADPEATNASAEAADAVINKAKLH